MIDKCKDKADSNDPSDNEGAQTPRHVDDTSEIGLAIAPLPRDSFRGPPTNEISQLGHVALIGASAPEEKEVSSTCKFLPLEQSAKIDKQTLPCHPESV